MKPTVRNWTGRFISGLDSPAYVALDGLGHVFVADISTGTIGA
jgi:hypothetical protein